MNDRSTNECTNQGADDLQLFLRFILEHELVDKEKTFIKENIEKYYEAYHDSKVPQEISSILNSIILKGDKVIYVTQSEIETAKSLVSQLGMLNINLKVLISEQYTNKIEYVTFSRKLMRSNYLNKDTVYITALIDHEERYRRHDKLYSDKYMSNFRKLASTGIRLFVFCSKKYSQQISSVEGDITIIEDDLSIKDLWTDKVLSGIVKGGASGKKDSCNFMKVINCKQSFVAKIANSNIDAIKFAWIDFGIWYIVKNELEVSRSLRSSNYNLGKGILIPGIRGKLTDLSLLEKAPYWRFAGGFFVGTKKQINEMDRLVRENISEFLKVSTFALEVNLWSYLELKAKWEPNVIMANHDDSMLTISG